jgi:hypothetical protein
MNEIDGILNFKSIGDYRTRLTNQVKAAIESYIYQEGDNGANRTKGIIIFSLIVVASVVAFCFVIKVIIYLTKISCCFD